MVFVEFELEKDSETILLNSYKLKGSSVSINRDVSINSRIRRKNLLNVRRQIREQDKNICIVLKDNGNLAVGKDKTIFDWIIGEVLKYGENKEDGYQQLKEPFNISINTDVLATPNKLNKKYCENENNL